MATRSHSGHNRDFGNLASVADLPNSAGAPVQTSTLQAGDRAYITGAGGYTCISATLGSAVWQADAAVSIDPESGTSLTMGDADAGKLIQCTAATTVTVTVPTGLVPGNTVEYLQDSTGQVQVVAGAGMTVRVPTSFLARTAERYSSLIVTILDSTHALVRGDLEAA